MKLLLIEDDQKTADYIAKGLAESGYVVDTSHEGRDGLFMASGGNYDALIVDRMLPGMDGLAVIAALRAGGDDYLVKPFAFAELLARIEALLRRGPASSATVKLKAGPLEMDLLSRNVTRQGRDIDLLPREFRLLEFLMRHAGQVVTRTMLLENVWDYHFDPQTNVIDVHVSRLRQKLDKGFDKPLLQTVRGAGYRLTVE